MIIMNKSKYFFIGFISAIILVIIAGIMFDFYKYKNRVVYQIKKEIKLENGMVVPKGTLLVKDHSMPEGYDEFKINIRIFRGYIDESLVKTKDNTGAYYWLDEKDIKETK